MCIFCKNPELTYLWIPIFLTRNTCRNTFHFRYCALSYDRSVAIYYLLACAMLAIEDNHWHAENNRDNMHFWNRVKLTKIYRCRKDTSPFVDNKDYAVYKKELDSYESR